MTLRKFCLSLVFAATLVIAALAPGKNNSARISVAYAQMDRGTVFLIDSTDDAPDSNPGDGICAAGGRAEGCTLRAAIQEANALRTPVLIRIPAGTYLLRIPRRGTADSSSGDLDISGELRLEGAGAARTTIDANQIDRVFNILPGAHVKISGVTIQGGADSAGSGGGILINSDAGLGLSEVNLIANESRGSGGGIFNADNARLRIVRSAIAFNTASRAGGGIANAGSLTIDNSTISANAGERFGGGIANVGPGEAEITNSTLADNSSEIGGGGGIANLRGTVRLLNSIIANSPAGGNCAGIFISGGSNLSSDRSCNFAARGDLVDTNPRLGPLGTYEGVTLNHPPDEDSPVIDAGTGNVSADQLGDRRPYDGNNDGVPQPDIGGIEWSIYKYILDRRVYLAAYFSGNLRVMSTLSNTELAPISLGGSPQNPALPVAVAVHPIAARVYATLDFTNKVRVIETDNNNNVYSWTVGSRSNGLAVNIAKNRVYVTNFDNDTVSVVNPSTGNVVATVNVGDEPSGVAVEPIGIRAYVANQGSNTVSVIDTTNNSVVATIPVGTEPFGIAAGVNQSAGRVYVANGGSDTVSVINTATNQVVATIPVGDNPTGVAVRPDGSRVYVTNNQSDGVSIIDTSTNQVVASIPPIGNGPWGVAVHPYGSRFYVSNRDPGASDSSSVSVINAKTNQVVTVVSFGSGFPTLVSLLGLAVK